MIVAETETSATKSLTVLHVAAGGECVANDDVDLVSKSFSGASHEYLLPISGGGSGALDCYLHDKLDSFSGERLERFVEADPSGVLAFLDESGWGRHIERHQRVRSDEGLPSGDVDCVLRSELQHSSSCGTKRPLSSDVDVQNLGRPPSKSVMFDIENGSDTCESSSRKLHRMSIVGHAVPSSSQYGGAEYGTSELASIARKKADEPVG